MKRLNRAPPKHASLPHMRGSISILLGLLMLGCGADDTGSTVDSSASTDSSATMNPTTAPSTSAGSSGGPIDGGRCVAQCETPTDCCSNPGDLCPGPYPFNWDCVAGRCVPPACSVDADCGVTDPPLACRPVDGHPTCVQPCGADPSICNQPNSTASCTGTADDGTPFCFEPCGAFLVCDPSVCDPDSGLCVCSGDAQCREGSTCIPARG